MIKDEWFNEESGLYKCPYCSKEYSRKGISTHILRQHESPERFKNSGTTGMTSAVISVEIETEELCSYGCGEKAKFIVSNKLCCSSHFLRCSVIRKKNSDGCKNWMFENPDKKIEKYDHSMYSEERKNKMNWSKGLTKETNENILKRSIELKEGYESGRIKKGNGKAKTDAKEQERKNKLSIARVNYLENSKHIQWLKLSNGISVQGKWEYNVGEMLLKQGYKVSRIKIYYDNHRRYTPDFCINDGEFFVEVKGWLSDRDIEKYKKVFKDNEIKVFLIRDELGLKNYSKFINEKISLFDCEDLKEAIYT